eukprot:Seg1022.2 transcript_id=Seg1022.2/GoldUCD/mRNA.D3Y31 product="putative transposase-like protein" protein_id=Seg1022.2/GoldUCD/D3Y31
MDFSCQVSSGKKRHLNQGCQFGASKWTDAETQFGESLGSYRRKFDGKFAAEMNHRRLLKEVLCNKEVTISWLMEEGLLRKEPICPSCGDIMNLISCNDRSDGVKWQCFKRSKAKKHKQETSLRSGSWFEKSNFTLEEILEFTYFWCQGLEQQQIRREVGCSRQSAVDWDMFCRETCEVVLAEESEPIGGEGKRVQIDESKFGKRKYHRGHKVEGQWVFGGIEEDSRRCFMVPVEKRDRETLLPIIEEWILPNTTIISDCWKPYDILSELDFAHLKVNHSKEFVNEDGDHTNKIEAHWRQAKASFPKFGVKKEQYSSYLAKFIWRYRNKGDDLFKTFINDITKVYDINK